MAPMRFFAPALAALTLSLVAPVALATDQMDFEKAHEAAVAAKKKAASVGGEWRDTGKILKKAKTLAKSGDYEAAIKLARKAEHQGHQGYEQMVSQAGKVGPEPFLQ